MDLSESKDTWERLARRFEQNWPGASEVSVSDFSRLSAGHSSDVYLFKADWSQAGRRQSQKFVLRTPPDGVGLLEPYDMGKEFRVMQALHGSKVPVPTMCWLDTDETVIGKTYYVMECLDGQAVEMSIPEYLRQADKEKIRRICCGYVETIAAIHTVDWQARGLAFLGDGANMLERDLAWWENEIRRFQQGPLPAFDVILEWLKANKPQQTPTITLVHGDCKPGNIFLSDETVTAMLDWEMVTIGDPMTDIGWFSCLHDLMQGGGVVGLPGALSKQEMLDYYQELSGIEIHDLNYYEVFALFKMVVIQFVGSMLYDTGKSSDLRYLCFGGIVKAMLDKILAMIGVIEPVAYGKVLPGWGRILAGTTETINNVLMPELQSQVARTQAGSLLQLIYHLSSGIQPEPVASKQPFIN